MVDVLVVNHTEDNAQCGIVSFLSLYLGIGFTDLS